MADIANGKAQHVHCQFRQRIHGLSHGMDFGTTHCDGNAIHADRHCNAWHVGSEPSTAETKPVGQILALSAPLE